MNEEFGHPGIDQNKRVKTSGKSQNILSWKVSESTKGLSQTVKGNQCNTVKSTSEEASFYKRF